MCALLWNPNERELLSSHGFTQNQLILWKYPTMTKATPHAHSPHPAHPTPMTTQPPTHPHSRTRISSAHPRSRSGLHHPTLPILTRHP